MSEFVLLDPTADQAAFSPVGLEMKKGAEPFTLTLDEHTLTVQNESGETEMSIQREDAWTALELIPSFGKGAILKLKKDNTKSPLLLRTTRDDLHTVKQWMGPTTREQLVIVLRGLVRRNFLWGLAWILLGILFPPGLFAIGFGFLTFGQALVAKFLPHPLWFITEGLIGLWLVIPFVAGILVGGAGWWFAIPMLLILANPPAGVARYRLWTS